MKRWMKTVVWVACVMLVSSAAMAAKPQAGAVKASAVKVSTLENLQIAYNGEVNAQAKYLEFAKKAKAEGYLRVAKLFEAVAMSEGIHADHHAKQITALKGTPQAVKAAIKIGTTQENLKAALAGETEEIEKMYPAFMKQAEAEKLTDAMHSFGGAKAIEAIHAAWYKQALAELPKWKADGDFYTCKVCGNVVDKLDFEYCAICKAPRSEFVKAL